MGGCISRSVPTPFYPSPAPSPDSYIPRSVPHRSIVPRLKTWFLILFAIYYILCSIVQTHSMANRLSYNYIEEYLEHIQSKGSYTVTLDELKAQFDSSEKAIHQNIYRLKRKNQLAQVRKGFYVIIPPQYSSKGMVPPTLFMDDMMRFLRRDYYVGLLSAAALHGAGHQQPMEFQVIIKKPPLRRIKNRKLNINFFIKKHWNSDQITEKKTETGYLKVSSPELTVFDLVDYNKKIGGLNRILPILEELAEEVKPSTLRQIAKTQKTPNLQRLGYLLDALGRDKLCESLLKVLGNKPEPILLSLAHRSRGSTNRKWGVVINAGLDI